MLFDASRFKTARKLKNFLYSPKVAGRAIYYRHRVKEFPASVRRKFGVRNHKTTPSRGRQIRIRSRPLSVHRKLPAATSSREFPFVRRDAMASRQGSANSQTSCSQTLIHSPIPRRVQPELSTRIEDGARLHNVDAGEHKYGRGSTPRMSHAANRLKHIASSINPARNNVICPRHGRRLHPRKRGLMTTTEGLEKSYSGAYIPIGRQLRHQVDALNPWVMFGKCLAKQEGTTVSPEICPDCIAEQNILDRELAEELQATSAGIKYGISERDIPGFGSMIAEAGTPTSQRQAKVLIDPAGDDQTTPLPGAAGVRSSLHDCGSVIAADLGSMLDAIIIEHSGILDKVITNIRNGVLGSERMHKLSQDLAKVSDTVATMPEDQFREIPTFGRDHGRGKHAMILDMDPLLVRQHTQSVPQLLDFIDATARNLGLKLSEAQQNVNQDTMQLLGQAFQEHIPLLHRPHSMALYRQPQKGHINRGTTQSSLTRALGHHLDTWLFSQAKYC
ncbi:hypothetical protein BDV97DRAFT_366992 [Delphinella strobiligena]|nr:hypothetical protein BDV97DRAFT_366992 [Delphinella strobiligena]